MGDCYRMEVVEPMVQKYLRKENPKEPLEACIMHGVMEEDENLEVKECAQQLNSLALRTLKGRWHFEELGLVKNLAAELGQYGIRVNCVSPYGLVTGISGNTVVDPAIIETKLSEMGNLRGEVLKAEGIANAALYLASDEASYVSGQNLVVDGGFSSVNPTFMKAFNLIK
ncbi:hypothetical protein EZV62_016020 [Acer yangbiense]|uniref:Uncharacterized protein n=1 Tax=Acer yangbiense TaxID=1000413 RepID=A0A5C7HMG0_9ROSI|nr:hypothetical protein EZV62_016020 [Acer yangbiense]